IAAQLTSTNGPRARAPLPWTRRATRPFPVPVSPWRRTVGTCGLPGRSKEARRSTWARRAAMAGALPMVSLGTAKVAPRARSGLARATPAANRPIFLFEQAGIALALRAVDQPREKEGSRHE